MKKNRKNLFTKGHKLSSKLPKLQKLGLEQEAYQSFCFHLADGGRKDTWHFEHEKLSLTFETMEKYIEENPSIFPAIKKKIAEAKGHRKWEKTVEEHALGRNECVTPALQMVMRNKFGWDKPDKSPTEAPPQFDSQLQVLKKVEGKWTEKKEFSTG